jgi:hypothetical protein
MVSLANADNNTEFDCEYFSDPSPNNMVPYYNTGVDHVSFIEYWTLNRTLDLSNDARCQVRLYWESNARSMITSNSDLRLASYRTSNGLWNNQGGTGTGGATGSITSTTILTEFNKVTFASSAGVDPLPVELLEFTAVPDGDVIDLDWTTATENGNDHFEVERSSDGNDFASIAMVNGAGSSMEEQHYSAVDAQPFSGLNFYRLKQVDVDGAFTYSEVVVVRMDGQTVVSDPVLFPNPGSGELNIVLDGEGSVTFQLVDALGRVALTERREITAGTKVNMNTDALPAGSYQLIATSANGVIGSARWLKVD